jgi:hypothetical protein
VLAAPGGLAERTRWRRESKAGIAGWLGQADAVLAAPGSLSEPDAVVEGKQGWPRRVLGQADARPVESEAGDAGFLAGGPATGSAGGGGASGPLEGK